MAMNRTDIRYRGHRIIANETGAMIYQQTAQQKIEGSDMHEALSNAKRFIDSKYHKRETERRAAFIGTVDDYSEALATLQLGKHETAMLSAHRNATNKKMTATEISAAAGWEGVSPANSHYGKLAKRVAEQISLKISGGDDQAWTEALASFDEETRQWEMHDELACAIDRLNIA